MNNYQNVTNYIYTLSGDLVKDISGKDQFVCNLLSMPTPEVSISSTTYGRHPLENKQKGKNTGTIIENDDLLDLEVLVDQDFEAYLFIMKWMVSFTPQYRNFTYQPETIAEVIALDDAGQPVIVFQYNRVAPNRLGQLLPSAQTATPDLSILPVSMVYDSFRVTDGVGNVLIG